MLSPLPRPCPLQTVLERYGELMRLRHAVNLTHDLANFYWDRDYLEQLYDRTCNFLDIHSRRRYYGLGRAHASLIIFFCVWNNDVPAQTFVSFLVSPLFTLPSASPTSALIITASLPSFSASH